MLSVREARRFLGDGPISLAALARLERRNFPVGVRDLITVRRHDLTGRVAAGDVSCTYTVTVYSNGAWYITGDVHDDGDLFGDSFVLDFLLDQQHGVGKRFTGELGAGDDTRITDQGIDPWIRDNFAALTRLRATIQVTPDVASIVEAVLLVLAVAAVVSFFAGPGKVEARQCTDRPFDNHDQCVEFHKVQE